MAPIHLMSPCCAPTDASSASVCRHLKSSHSYCSIPQDNLSGQNTFASAAYANSKWKSCTSLFTQAHRRALLSDLVCVKRKFNTTSC
eukprot:832597-Amphidinium_carterae.2